MLQDELDVYLQLELPTMKVPSEFSHPQTPDEGSVIQFVPTPLDSPVPLQDSTISTLVL